MLEGHEACSEYLEDAVRELLSKPANLDSAAQNLLLNEVKPVFTKADNEMLKKIPDKAEVKGSVWTANINASPGSDGLTTFLYKHCWDTLGDSLRSARQCLGVPVPLSLNELP